MRRPRRRPRYAAQSRGARKLALAHAAREFAELRERPTISIVMPTYNTAPRYLREAIESVRRQHYSEWELVIVDDGSTAASVRPLIERYAAADPRIRAELLTENEGISGASNRGLELCSGELVAFIDHDDALAPTALLRLVQAFAAGEVDVVYTDQDKLDLYGRRADTFLKPDWSPVYALGAMYIGHLLALRRELAVQVGGFDSAFDTIQDFEFLLRVSERTDRITHVPEILYHWRAIPGSIAAGTEEKSGVPELQAKAVNGHLERLGAAARARPHDTIAHRVRLDPVPEAPKPPVSVVILASGDRAAERRCLDSLFDVSGYPSLEVIVVAGSSDGAGESGPAVTRLVDDAVPASRARARNLGIKRSSGEYVVFLADSAEVAEPDWVEQLLMYARLPKVGVAGPMLVHPDGRVAAAGIAIGLRDPALAVMEGRDAGGDGYYGSLPCAREVAAVSADCMIVERELLTAAGGFAEIYSTQYEDVDLCQRIRALGRSVVYAPAPRTVSHRPAAGLADLDVIDRALFVDAWYEQLAEGDPYYNPDFSPDNADYEIDLQSRVDLEMAIAR